MGEIISASAEIRVQPRESCQDSAWTFSRPILFIFSTPQAMAFAASGEPVTRPPISSLSSRRFSYVSVSIIPAPAIVGQRFKRSIVELAAELRRGFADCRRCGSRRSRHHKQQKPLRKRTQIFFVSSIKPLSDVDYLRPRECRAKLPRSATVRLGSTEFTWTLICADDQEHLSHCFRFAVANSNR